MTNDNADRERQIEAPDALARKGRSRRARWLGVGAAAVALALLVAACTGGGGERGTGGGESPGEHGSAAESAEGAEGRDGGGSGEASEGGVVNLLAPDQVYDEVRSGARLILSYDAGANAFTGTVENTTNAPLTRARVEGHLSSGAELGPTTPTDLAVGEVVSLNLPATAAPFDTWSAHPEVGSGEGSDGSEGNTSEGSEGGAEATTSTTTHLSSTGISRGTHTTPGLATDDSYAGKLNDLELAVTFDPASGSFVGRVKNEASAGLCNTTLSVVLDGNRSGHQSVLIPALDLGARVDFTLDSGSASFKTWATEAETFSCSTVISDAGEGGERTGGEGGSGEGREGSSGEGVAESGEETSRSTPIDQVASGSFNSLDYRIAYDPATQAFRGSIENNKSQVVCGSRLEIHIASSGQVIELGPTIDRDLAPGESLAVVLSAAPITPDTFSLHPESSPCP